MTDDSGLASYVAGQVDRSLSWKDLKWLKRGDVNIIMVKTHENRRQLFSATTSKENANPFVRQRPLANKGTTNSSNSPPPWANDSSSSSALFPRKQADAESQPLIQDQQNQQQQMVPLQDSYMQSRAEALHNVESTIHEFAYRSFTELGCGFDSGYHLSTDCIKPLTHGNWVYYRWRLTNCEYAPCDVVPCNNDPIRCN